MSGGMPSRSKESTIKCQRGVSKKMGQVARSLCSFFFFQAEDGIRDDLVTGVQTCALPICQHKSRVVLAEPDRVRCDEDLNRGTILQDVRPRAGSIEGGRVGDQLEELWNILRRTDVFDRHAQELFA